ncbi:MAG: DUF2461 domain-containing protein [Bacteroidetes bacterium]|jgi:uncharacterized protein (TIGR02453 family)|nr:DUF2461 domain-containing protein [Bacteroidota bacterium]
MANPLADLDEHPPFEGFPKEGITFLRRLKRNNRREWFAEHKTEYEDLVKAPMQSLIASLRPHVEHFAPEFELNPRTSIFRVYRDTRFSSDKTPYKTHVAAHFVLRGAPKGFLGSGYYMEVEPGGAYVGGGIYMPEGDQLKKIRAAIDRQRSDFLSIINAKPFRRRFGKLEGATLQRMPKGYDDEHPLGKWLKLKQFFAGESMPVAKAMRASFVTDVAAVCETLTPLVRFLNDALRR